MSQIEKIEILAEDVKQYVSTSFDLIKLETAERASIVGTGMISGMLLGMFGMLFVFFVSLGAGFYLSTILGNSYLGFVIVGGFYLVLIFILSLIKKEFIDKYVRDKVIQKIFSKDE